jgi:DNA-binding CsgD family transcriptional regulator
MVGGGMCEGRLEERPTTDWLAADARLAAADAAAPLPPGDLERWAVAAFLLGRDEQVIELLERAHLGYLAAGLRESAVRCAYWIGFHLQNRGEAARAAGWLAVLRRLLSEEDREGPLAVLVLMPEAVQLMWSGRAADALPAFERAAVLAQQGGDPDNFVLANLARGNCLLQLDRTDEAVVALDEAMVHVTADRVSPQVIGLAYCSVIAACMMRFDVGRASEWTRALSGWCDAQSGLVPYRGVCLVHRAELLQLRGSWDEAIGQARQARIWLQQSGEGSLGAAHYRLAELLRLRGDLDSAERAYAQAAAFGYEAQPGLALLRVAQGRVPAAMAGLDRAIAERREMSAWPDLLAVRVDLALQVNDLDGARQWVSELTELAQDRSMPYLRALAARAEGTLCLSLDDAQGSLPRLRAAWAAWQEVDAPYEAARTRVLVASACRRLGDEDAARMEEDAARSVYSELGAFADLAALDKQSQPLQGRDGKLSRRELEVLRLLATGLTNRDIAAQLFLSEKTVARHLSNIFAKLEVSSRSAATAYAHREHLL